MRSSTLSKICTDTSSKGRWGVQLTLLTRPRLGAGVAATGLVGFLINPQMSTASHGVLVFFAVLLLAMASSAWNQVQEIDIDRVMTRTCQRPLVTGVMAVGTAWGVVATLFIAGGLILFSLSPISLIPSLLTIISYNLIYTPLKRHTTLALIPGAICGMLPPAIGWYAVSGITPGPLLIHFMALIFLWQIPHFILQELRCGDDYRRTNLPTLGRLFSPQQLRMMLGVWLVALLAATLMLVRLLASLALGQMVLAGAVVLVLCFMCWMVLVGGKEMKVVRLFHSLNGVMGLLILLLVM